MKLVLVRHGSRNGDGLSQHGRHEIETLAQALRRRGVIPSLYASSSRAAAVESCDMVAAIVDRSESNRRLTCRSLTPRSGSAGHFDDLVEELVEEHVKPAPTDVVLLVGHEGRLSNLLTDLTGMRSRPFEHGSCVCVEAQDHVALLKGRGTIDFRFPVVEHSEAELQAKAHSKMTVASFFAGFVFAALIEILLTAPLSSPRQVAAVVLTLSLALFVASIYIYDQLSMPPGFWTDGPRARLFRWLAARRERARERRWTEITRTRGAAAADDETADVMLDGALFVAMVSTSRFLFTPAVALSFLGFAAIVLDTRSKWVMFGAAPGVLVAIAYFLVQRPALGAD